MKTVISLDLGTSSVRTCLMTPALEILFQSQRVVSVDTNSAGKAVQDAEVLIEAGLSCLIETLTFAWANGYAPEAVCFSNTSASLVCLNSEFEPLGPALTYMDLRAYQEAAALLDQYGARFFRETAVPMHASYWLPKLLWLNGQSDLFTRTVRFCGVKDLLVYRLTGQFMTDQSNAFANGMGDVRTGNWHSDLLRLADLHKEQLPTIRSCRTCLPCPPNGPLPAEIVPKGFQVVLGAMDGVLSSVGAGAFLPGQVTTMIGSSGACRVARQTPILGDEVRTWSYPLEEDLWICGGAMNNGGLVTQWLKENFSRSTSAEDDSYDSLFRIAEEVEPGTEGLLFLPYLFGERAPIYNERARGVFFGLQNHHRQAHFSRAGLEGILLALYTIFELLPKDTPEIEVRATGGYLRSDLMLKIQADVFGVPIHVPENLEGSSVGAAMLALKAIDEIESYADLSPYLPIVKTVEPNLDNHARYQDIYRRFRALYQQLEPLF